MLHDREILQSLQTATLAAVAASSMPTLPIKAMGRIFNPPNDGKYLEIVSIPNNIVGEFWDKGKTYRGVLRLILHWPNDDIGDYPPIDVLSSIVSYFTKDREYMNNVKILEEPDYLGSIEKGESRLFPASMRYQRFVAP